MPERIDALSGGFSIIQDTDSFCFGTDAVCLSRFAVARRAETLIDLCSGNGIVMLLIAARSECAAMTGLEIDERAAGLARRNVKRNGLEERCRVVRGDLKEWKALLPAGRADVVTCNPPYMVPGTGKQNAAAHVTGARHEVLCTLSDVAGAASGLLRCGGRFYMVHRTQRLADVICAMRGAGLEPKRLQMICHHAGARPELFLVEGQKGRRPGLAVLPPMLVSELEY